MIFRVELACVHKENLAKKPCWWLAILAWNRLTKFHHRNRWTNDNNIKTELPSFIVIFIYSLILLSEYQIGCFRSPAGLFSETLGDFTHENNPINAVMQCKELARRKNYRVFALGHGGVCMSGADAKDSYYLHQPPHRKTWCSNGIGIGDTSVVYSFGNYNFVTNDLIQKRQPW